MSPTENKFAVNRVFAGPGLLVAVWFLGMATLTGSTSAWATPVNLQQFNSFVAAWDNANTGPSDVVSTSISGIPGATSATAALSASSNSVQLAASGDNSGAIFSFDTQQSISSFYGYTRAYGELIFSISETTSYSLDGFFNSSTGSMADYVPHPSPGLMTGVAFFVGLYTLNWGGPFFADQSLSYSTPDETFVLGDLNDGDAGNYTAGSLNGQLTAGNYRLYYENYIQDYSNVDASASGGFTLTLGNPASVPEPRVALLMVIGLLGLGLQQMHRRLLLTPQIG